MKVKIEKLLRWANWLPERVTDRNMVQHPAWTIPDPYCVRRYADDKRHFPGDAAPECEKL